MGVCDEHVPTQLRYYSQSMMQEEAIVSQLMNE